MPVLSRTAASLVASPLARFAALAVLVAGLALVTVVLGPPEPGELATRVTDWGPLAPTAAVLACAALMLALVPRTLLAAAAGLVFGPLTGAGYVLLGATIGALLAYGVGRWLGRDFVAAQAMRVLASPDSGRLGRRLARLDGWLTHRGVLGVLTVRLLPIAPFGLVSYAFGASGARTWAYLVGTVAGMTPTTVVYANLGAAALRPGSTAFLYSVAAAVLLWSVTVTATVWLSRRRTASGRLETQPGA